MEESSNEPSRRTRQRTPQFGMSASLAGAFVAVVAIASVGGISLATALLEIVTVAIVGALTVIVAGRMLNGSINTAGLLADSTTGQFSGARLQLLIATLFGAATYVLMVAQDADAMPDVPPVLLLLIGGSNAGYLLSKIHAHLAVRRDGSEVRRRLARMAGQRADRVRATQRREYRRERHL